MAGIKKFIKNVLKNKPEVIYFPLLFLTVYFAYGKILNLYFWRDDFTNLYHTQIGKPFEFPYQSMIFLLKLPYLLFGLNPNGYYILAIVLLTIASFAFYYLSFVILKNKFIAFISSLIFSSGYIGSGAIQMFLGDGLYSLVGIIFSLLTLILFFLFLKNKTNIYLYSTYILCFISYEIAPHRIFGLIPSLILTDWIFSNKKKLKKIFLRSLIFLFILLLEYYIHPFKYLFGYEVIQQAKTIISPKLFIYNIGTFSYLLFPDNLVNNLTYINKPLNSLSDLFKSQSVSIICFSIYFFLNVYIQKAKINKYLLMFSLYLLSSSTWIFIVFKNFQSRPERFSLAFGGIFLLFSILILSIRKIYLKKVIVFSFMFIFSMLLIFPLTGSSYSIPSHQRYLLPLLMAFPFIITIFLNENVLNFKKDYKFKINGFYLLSYFLFIIPSLLIVITHAYSTNKYFADYENNYGKYTKPFFEQINTLIPKINTPTIMIFNTNDPTSVQVLGNILRVGRYPSEIIFSVLYQTDFKNIKILNSSKDLKNIDNNSFNLKKTNIYVFKYTPGNLIKQDFNY